MKWTTRVSHRRCILPFLLLAIFTRLLMGQAQTGQWTTLSYTMPINPVHVALLHNGKILVVAGSGNCPASLAGCPSGPPFGPANSSGALLLDPTNGNITQFNVSWDMFCNGMVVLPDGRAFINGGTLAYDPFKGQPKSSIFDPSTNTFTDTSNMAHGRWYPTVLTLGDGRIMTFSGFLETGENTNTTVEFYTVGSGWSQPYTAPFTPDLYPRLHVLPSGKVFYSGAPPVSQLFDPSTTSWTLNVATTNYGGTREYGSSVLLGLTPANNYDPVVLIMGGDSPATKTTETIDMGASTPKWTYGPNMSQARIEMNAVLLPNGQVVALGGSVNDEDLSTKSLNADLYTPATSSTAASIKSAGVNVYARLYHSVALLLPDATVWLAGGNPSRGSYEPHIEVYQPPYLFQSNGTLATRPTITSAPASIGYGNPFTVQTPDAASIASAVLVRAGSVTHAFGMDQRMVGMSFTAGSGSLTITAPANGNIAPPGYYMLFLLNTAGVPSVSKFVQVTSSGSSGPPSGISFVQGGSGPASIQASNTSVAVAFPSAQTAGNLNIVAVGWGDTTSSISSVTDSKGNVYTRAAGPTVNGGQQSIYYAKNIAGGTNTVTVTFNQAASYPDVRILEYSGLDTTSPLDVTAGAVGTGAAASSGAATTTVANELIFGTGTAGGNGFSGAGSGYTSRVMNIYGSLAEDKIVSATGSYSATGTVASSTWIMQMATFKGSGQGSGGGNPAPTVSSISPTSGTANGGTAVTITGTGFLTGATVSLGGTAATGVTVSSSTKITATTPAHAAGAVNVVVTNTDGQIGTLTGGFTYTGSNPAPTVSSISPTSGTANGGTAVTITGTGFLAGATVSLGGTAATAVTVSSSTKITAITPAHAAGAVNVVVMNTDGQSGTLSGGYTYTSASGGGISFVQAGTGPTSIQALNSAVVVPYPAAQTAGNLNIVAVGWGDTTSSISSVTDSKGNVYTRAAGPTVNGGQQSIYYAKNIAGGTNTVTVTFNQAASYPDVRILEYSGLDTTSPLDVTAGAVGTGAAASSGAATTTVANELIFGTGTAGGNGFSGAGSGYTSRVMNIYGSLAEDKIVSATGSYSATGTVASSTWIMQMATFKGSGQGSGGGNPAPTVSSISPTSGTANGGTAVTITGTGFLTGATVSLGGTAATGVTVSSSTKITATTPAHAAGAVNVVVTNTDGQIGTLTGGFTYTGSNPAPTVSSISPTSGTANGGTAVTITGTGFLAGATVSLGGTAATAVTVSSSTKITAITPAHAAGAVNVVVMNTDGQSGTLSGGYTYTSASGGGISFVQAGTGPTSIQALNSAVVVPYPAAQTAGNLNIVAVGWGDTTSSISSVTDSKGNVYTRAAGPTVNGGQQSIYYAKNIAGGTNTVTVTFNQAASYPDVRILEYSGLDTTSPLDVTAGAVGTGAAASSGAATTTVANELIFGTGTAGGNGFSGAGSGYTSRVMNIYGSLAEDKIVSATGSYSATGTVASSTWIMQMATFKAQQ